MNLGRIKVIANRKSGAVHHEHTTTDCAVETMSSMNRIEGYQLPWRWKNWEIVWFPCKACWKENGFKHSEAQQYVHHIINYEWEM